MSNGGEVGTHRKSSRSPEEVARLNEMEETRKKKWKENRNGISELERENGINLDNIDNSLDQRRMDLKQSRHSAMDEMNSGNNGNNGNNDDNGNSDKKKNDEMNILEINSKLREREKDDINFSVKSHTISHDHLHLRGQSVMFLILLVMICQSIVWFWKRRHFKSFFVVTLFGLWIFPALLVIYFGLSLFVRLFIIWILFTLIMCFLFIESMKKPLGRHTPRVLYSWFYSLYRVTSILSIVGYFCVLLDAFGANKVFYQTINKIFSNYYINSKINFSHIGILFLFYGLYFGVLSRDTAQLCSDKVAQTLGFFNATGFPRRRVPSNICAVCNERLQTGLLQNFMKSANEREMDEKETSGMLTSTESRMRHMQRREETRKRIENDLNDNNGLTKRKKEKSKKKEQYEEIHLECGHCFHSFCIRGWVMIGKKNVCPICMEKVDMSGIFANPWHKQDRIWSQILDAIRYLLVWNPIIAMSAHFVFTLTGMKMEEHVTHEYTVYEIGHQ